MLIRNASWSVIVSAYRAGTNLLSALLAVKLLGEESYGNIAVIISIFALFFAFASAIFMVLVPKLINARKFLDFSEWRSLCAAANFLALISIALIFLFAALAGYSADHLRDFGLLNDNFWNLVRSGSLVFALLTGLQIYSSLNSAMLEGDGRLDLAVKSQILGPTIILSGLLYVLIFFADIGISTYLALLCLGSAIDVLNVWIMRRVIIVKRLSLVSRQDVVRCVPDLLKSGASIQFSAFLNILLDPFNKLLLIQFAGGSGVTAYDLAMKVIWGLQSLFGALLRVFLHLQSHGAQVIANKYIRAMSFLIVPVVCAHIVGALMLAVYANYVVPLDQTKLMLFFGLATVSNLCMIYITPLYVSLIAYGDLNFLFKNQIRLTLANLICSPLLIPEFGLVGAAFGLLVAMIYNTRAIYVRFNKRVGPLDGFKKMASAVVWRFSVSIVLLIATIIFGGQEEVNIIFIGLLISALLLLIVREPLVFELKKRLLSNLGS